MPVPKTWEEFLDMIEEYLEDLFGQKAGNGGLRHDVVSGPVDLGCGEVDYKVRWRLDDMTKTGWIIQHITYERTSFKCGDKTPDVYLLEYYEAWEVAGGQVWRGHAASGVPHQFDWFYGFPAGSTIGSRSWTGRVRFVDSFKLDMPPWVYGFYAAQNLPALLPPAEPTGWSDKGADNHNLQTWWNCCVNPGEQDSKTELGPDPIKLVYHAARALFGPAPRAGDPLPMRNPSEFSENAKNAAVELDSIPQWGSVPGDDFETRRKIIRRMSELAADSETEFLRDVVAAYVEMKRASEAGYNPPAMSTLFVFLRVVFDASSEATFESPRYHGFVGVPHSGDMIDDLWPLSVDQDGALKLTGVADAYKGDEMLALREFDFLNQKYGRRPGLPNR